MRTVIAVIVGAGAMLPAAALAQTPGRVVPVRTVVPVVEQQTRVDRRAEERRKQQDAMRERMREQQARQFPASQTEKVERTMKLGARGELALTNLAGDIVITRGSGNEVRIEAVKTARARNDQEAKEMLALVQVEFTERGGRGEARTLYPGQSRGTNVRRNMNVTVAYTVTAPQDTRIRVHTLSGSIKATDIKGDLSLETLSGDVTIANAARVSAAKSTSGDVQITGTKSEIGIEAVSVSGNVLLSSVTAPRLQAETVSGSIRIENCETPRLEAQTVTGTVEFASPLQKNGRYDLQSHAGTVRIVLVGNVGFEFDANSFSGSVQSDVPFKDQETGSGFGGRRSGSRVRSMSGTYGDGSAMIDVTTFSGNVVVTKK